MNSEMRFQRPVEDTKKEDWRELTVSGRVCVVWPAVSFALAYIIRASPFEFNNENIVKRDVT